MTSAEDGYQEEMSSATVEAAVSASALLQFRRAESLRSEELSLLSDASESSYAAMSAARLRVEKHRTWQGIQNLRRKAAMLLAKVKNVDRRIAEASAKMGETDMRQALLMKNMTVQQAKEQAKQKALEQVEERSNKIAGELGAEDSKIEIARKKLLDAMNSEEKAGADLAKEQAAETAALFQLAALVQEEHATLHTSLEQSHSNVTMQLRSNEETLEALASKENEKECDTLRASVIKAKARLEMTGTALLACLKAKKQIKAKIDQAVALGKKAAIGLASCLKTKADLKVKIAMCHERRDAAREKLKACLDRKKVLKVQIEKCHEKRDEARKKLADCLARKKDLKEKIAIAVAAKRSSSSLLQQMTDLEAEATAALDALHKGNIELTSALDNLYDSSIEEASRIHEMTAESEAGDEALSKCTV